MSTAAKLEQQVLLWSMTQEGFDCDTDEDLRGRALGRAYPSLFASRRYAACIGSRAYDGVYATSTPSPVAYSRIVVLPATWGIHA